MPLVFGYLLEGPRRPKLTEQKRILEVFEIDFSDPAGRWFHDKIRKGSTRPRSQLVNREDAVLATKKGDTVVVAAPYCLGVSARDVAWFLGALSDKGVTVIVNGQLRKVEPGDDVTDILDAVASAQNVTNNYRSTGRLK